MVSWWKVGAAVGVGVVAALAGYSYVLSRRPKALVDSDDAILGLDSGEISSLSLRTSQARFRLRGILSAIELARSSHRRVCLKRRVGDAHSTRSHPYKSRLDKSGNSPLPIDLSPLCHIRRVDVHHCLVEVEAMTTMRALTESLLEYNLIPAVCPEFNNITVGGAIQGLGIESGSFQHGLFEDTVLCLEVVTGDGELKWVSRDIEPDLFYGIFGSFGSIALVTCAVLRCVLAKSFVRLDITSFCQRSDWIEHFSNILPSISQMERRPDFFDAIHFSSSLFSSIFGSMVDEESIPPDAVRTRCDRWFDPLYYEEIESAINSSTDHSKTIVFMPIRDYLFRYDRGCFFMAYGIQNPVIRFLLGWAYDSRFMFRQAMVKPDEERENISMIQDVSVPLQQLRKLLLHLHMKLSIYPLWICPFRKFQSEHKLFSASGSTIHQYSLLFCGHFFFFSR